jgi:streptomycin 6-kinase
VIAHEGLRHLEDYPGGPEWLARLPRLRDECVERWSLRIGEPYSYAHVSLVVRAELPDGTPAVLKIGFPHRESEHEAAALAHYDGHGAVRLLARDRERHALLLERCEPGTTLLELEDEREAVRLAGGVLARLWQAPAADHPFRPIAADAARWIEVLPERWERLGRPFERALLDEAVAAFRELPPTQGELVVCHQDLHPGNILQAAREPWLAIDPKPVLAEREFDAVALLRWDGRHRLRLDVLAAELGLDRERMRRWALAHLLAWGFDESPPSERMLTAARGLRSLG